MNAYTIIKLIESGTIPEDTLVRLTPTLAKANDAAAPTLLNYQHDRRLWEKWGYTSETDYLVSAGIPVHVYQASTALMLCDALMEPHNWQPISEDARQEIVRLLKDKPTRMSSPEFMVRLEELLVVLSRGDQHGAETSDQQHR